MNLSQILEVIQKKDKKFQVTMAKSKDDMDDLCSKILELI